MSGKHDGLFITLEGPDGCGKSTQVNLLSEWLKSEGYDIKTTKEPGENPIGELIRKSLEGKIELPPESQALLFASDRILHISKIIEPSLKEGKVVVSGRYVYSSLAYQTSLGLPWNWVESINKYAMEPDLAIFLDVPPEVAGERIDSSRETDKFEKNLELQKKVRRAYQDIAEENDFPLIDGTLSKEKVHEKIKSEVRKILTC